MEYREREGWTKAGEKDRGGREGRNGVCWKVVRLPWSGMDRWREVCGRGDEFRLHTGFLLSQEEILRSGQLSLIVSVSVPLSLFALFLSLFVI